MDGGGTNPMAEMNKGAILTAGQFVLAAFLLALATTSLTLQHTTPSTTAQVTQKTLHKIQSVEENIRKINEKHASYQMNINPSSTPDHQKTITVNTTLPLNTSLHEKAIKQLTQNLPENTTINQEILERQVKTNPHTQTTQIAGDNLESTLNKTPQEIKITVTATIENLTGSNILQSSGETHLIIQAHGIHATTENIDTHINTSQTNTIQLYTPQNTIKIGITNNVITLETNTPAETIMQNTYNNTNNTQITTPQTAVTVKHKDLKTHKKIVYKK